MIAAVLSECELFPPVQRCSSPTDNVYERLYHAVTSKRALLEIVEQAGFRGSEGEEKEGEKWFRDRKGQTRKGRTGRER